jgi:hypothetical protein
MTVAVWSEIFKLQTLVNFYEIHFQQVSVDIPKGVKQVLDINSSFKLYRYEIFIWNNSTSK